VKVDVTKIKPGVKVKLKDGHELPIRGAYMSVEGLVFTAQYAPGSIVDRNIPLSDIVEVKEDK